MPAELRLYYTDAYITHVAACLAAAGGVNARGFTGFVRGAGWEDLSLKARMHRLADALCRILPEDDYPFALSVLKRVMPQVGAGAGRGADMLAMFVPEYAVRRGREHFDLSMEALAFFTASGTSSEMAVRPFILADQKRAIQFMLECAGNENPHVRRFSSEGCRPRLPWAMALPGLKKNPAPLLPILEKLRADESLYVRKSVANNLNDISKDNPGTVLETAARWRGAHPHTDWILRRGCRSLLKKAQSRALALFGAAPVKIAGATLSLSARRVKTGGKVSFSFRGKITGPLPETLRLEYAVDFMKAGGKTSRKIFQISSKTPVGRAISVTKKHAFADLTTRKHYPGAHALAVLVNGHEVARETFTLLA